MSQQIKIPLKTPIVDHSGVIKDIVLRPPTFAEYMAIGDPFEVAETQEKVRYTVQSPAVIDAYLDACLIVPSDRAMLDSQGVSVARKVQRAILSFFREDDEEEPASTSSQSSSSSPAASTPAPSTA